MPGPRHRDAIAAVRAKLAAGTLPLEAPQKTWAGHGDGKLCDGCDEVVTQTQTEFEVDMADGLTIRFHQNCFTAWLKERAQPL